MSMGFWKCLTTLSQDVVGRMTNTEQHRDPGKGRLSVFGAVLTYDDLDHLVII